MDGSVVFLLFCSARRSANGDFLHNIHRRNGERIELTIQQTGTLFKQAHTPGQGVYKVAVALVECGDLNREVAKNAKKTHS